MTLFLFGSGSTYGTLCGRVGCPPIARDFGKALAEGHYPNLAAVARHLNCELSDIGMEDFWSCIDYYAKFSVARGGFLPVQKGWDLNAAVWELKSAILNIYGLGCDKAAKGITASTNCTLVKLLKTVRAGDTIVSFNYDTLVERLAKKLRLRLTHSHVVTLGNRVRFAKPHGSTSWQIKTVPAAFSGSPILTSLAANQIDHMNSATQPLVLGAVPIKSELLREVQCAYHACNVFTVIAQQWRIVFEAVRYADIIVAVGYRFPEEDEYGRFLLREAVRQRRKRLRKVEYFNTSRKIEAALRDVFGKGVRLVWRRKVTPAHRR